MSVSEYHVMSIRDKCLSVCLTHKFSKTESFALHTVKQNKTDFILTKAKLDLQNLTQMVCVYVNQHLVDV